MILEGDLNSIIKFCPFCNKLLKVLSAQCLMCDSNNCQLSDGISFIFSLIDSDTIYFSVVLDINNKLYRLRSCNRLMGSYTKIIDITDENHSIVYINKYLEPNMDDLKNSLYSIANKLLFLKAFS